MKIEDYRWLAGLIAAHPNGEVVGRTRLQKTVKLLQRLGFPTDYRYTIYFYGPYSEGLQAGVDLLDAFGLIQEHEHVSKDGTIYYTIRAGQGAELPEIKPFLPVIKELSDADLLVLELAATYDAFRELGCNHGEALQRLRRKKGDKCDNGRDAQALKLLRKIGLATK
jgi:uncharacterized protein YwgA